MNRELGPREKFLVLNGLVCLAKSLEGKHTTVDLRNETSVHGKIEVVDAHMNITMTNAVFTNWKEENQQFENFYIQARNIRYVHIPKEIPVLGAIKRQIRQVTDPGKGRGFSKMAEKSFKMKRAKIKQQETIAMIEKLKEERLRKAEEKEEKASYLAQEKVPQTLNVQYGPNSSQLLDFYGTDLSKESPIFVYIHGGYWQALSKDISAYPVIPLWKAGIRSAIVGYSLAPQVTLDTIIQEIRNSALFLLKKANEENCVGVWFGGHSAGGHLCASLLGNNWLNSLKSQWKDKLRGLVLISGIYDITPLLHTSENEALKLTMKNALNASPMFELGKLTVLKNITVLLAVAEHDPPAFHGQAAAYRKILNLRKLQTKVVEVPNTDHFTIVENLQDPTFELTQQIISLIKCIEKQ